MVVTVYSEFHDSNMVHTAFFLKWCTIVVASYLFSHTDVFNSSGYASDFDQASGGDDCVEARDLAALRDLDAVELGDAASILCDRSFQGSGTYTTYTCTETCEFSPPVQTCSRIICPDLKGSASGFDFTTASVGSIKAQYAPSDAVRIQCPAGEPL